MVKSKLVKQRSGFTLVEMLLSFTITMIVITMFMQLGSDVFRQEHALRTDFEVTKEAELVEQMIMKLFAWVNSEGSVIEVVSYDNAFTIFTKQNPVFSFNDSKMVTVIGNVNDNYFDYHYQLKHVNSLSCQVVNNQLLILKIHFAQGLKKQMAINVIGGIT